MTKRLNRPRTGTIVALDIGTSKACCLIARVDRPAIDNGSNVVAQPRIVGTGLQVSAGMKNGVIVDVEVAETAIRKAVFAAEQMAGDTIRSVTVNLNGGQPVSQTVGVDVDIGGLQIDDADLQRVFQQTLAIEGDGNGGANGHVGGHANGHRERNGHRPGRELNYLVLPNGSEYVHVITGEAPLILPGGWLLGNERIDEERTIHLPAPATVFFFPNGDSYQGPV